MTATAATEAGRRLYADLMVDTGLVTRGGGPPVFDEETGILVPAGGTTIYTGACRVRTATTQDQLVVFGGTDVTRTRFLISFPWDVVLLKVDDVVSISESGDPHIHLRAFRVIVVPSQTFLMYRQVGVEVIE